MLKKSYIFIDENTEKFNEEDLNNALAAEGVPSQMKFYDNDAIRSYANLRIMYMEEMRSLFVFLENWARLMEGHLNRGERLDEATIRRCERLADVTCGNSGASYSWCRNVLLVHWKHGELLLRPDEQLTKGLQLRYRREQLYTSDAEVVRHRQKQSI